MTSALSCAAKGWMEPAPAGNRVRWQFVAPEAALPALSAAAPPNALQVRCPAAPRGFIGPRAVIVQRAVIPPKEPRSQANELPDELRAIPSSWWSRSGDVPLRADIPYCGFYFGSPVQACWFTYRGPRARCVVDA